MENGHIAQTQRLVIEIGNQPVSVSECLLAPALRKRLHMVKRQLLKRLKANGSIRKFKGI